MADQKENEIVKSIALLNGNILGFHAVLSVILRTLIRTPEEARFFSQSLGMMSTEMGDYFTTHSMQTKEIGEGLNDVIMTTLNNINQMSASESEMTSTVAMGAGMPSNPFFPPDERRRR